LEYKYDSLGNITHIYKNNELINQYYYDQYNQLIKEESNNSKISYEYDNYGNILSKKTYQNNELVYISTYQYNNTNWQDQLTYYKECKVEKDENGNEVYTIIDEENLYYDELGNMSFTNEIGELALRYINGRQLSRYAKDDKLILYNYNKDGIRTYKGNGKNINNEYYVEGNKIIYIKINNDYMYFIYENDNVVGFKYDDIIYYYNKNLTNDIIGIRNSDNETIANYEYDSFGNILSITDNNNNQITNEEHIANINPFRYRSYYYDIETNLYYLNSRYYNPKWGRFISADNILGSNKDILSYNLYTYCSNNPINYSDPSGMSIISFLKDKYNQLKSNLYFDVGVNVFKFIVKNINIQFNNTHTQNNTYGNSFIGADIGKYETVTNSLGNPNGLIKFSINNNNGDYSLGVSLSNSIIESSLEFGKKGCYSSFGIIDDSDTYSFVSGINNSGNYSAGFDYNRTLNNVTVGEYYYTNMDKRIPIAIVAVGAGALGGTFATFPAPHVPYFGYPAIPIG